jgi:lactoylglutathione lyase
MKTLHVGLRVTDLDRSLAFYSALGYVSVGRVPDSPIGHLEMLKLDDDEYVTLELVHDPTRPFVPSGSLSHLVVQVASMQATLDRLAAEGIDADGPTSPNGSGDFLTANLADPDGNVIELVQWPAGHPVGMTAADFED